MKIRYWCVFFVLPVLLALLIVGLIPPHLISGYELRNDKIILDKTFLENIEYPKLFHVVFFVLNPMIGWLVPLTIDSICEKATDRILSYGETDYEFYLDTNDSIASLGQRPMDCAWGYQDTFWMKNLKVLLKSLDEEAMTYLSPFGRLAIREVIVNSLVNQARIVTYAKKNPSVMEENITKPIIIAGPPRTMTTHLQGILSKHPQTMYLSFLDAQYPLIPNNINLDDVGTHKDPRTLPVKLSINMFSFLRPLFSMMFRFNTEDPQNTVQEDIFILQMVFASSVFATQMYVPTYSQMLYASDLAPASRFLKLTQQVMQHQVKMKGGDTNKYWIMKTPEHAGYLDTLLEVYPDAKIILTHREPVSVVKSLSPMLLYFFSFWNNQIDVEKVANYEIDMIEIKLKRLVDHVDQIPKNQLLDIKFSDFVKDTMGEIKKVCEFLGLDLNPEIMDRFEKYIEESPRDGAKKFAYDIESLGHGFNSSCLNDRFAFYSNKFKKYVD